ncbi:hypothetical protein ACTXJX_13210 [Glutamicibacter ardleyensis]|uniref:hypothetical protein n=1 Tax=Glutamicibacter ardleyensis TaxID=225894 RepID=UPI003FD25D93
MNLSEEDIDLLAVAVDLVLSELERAEKQVSFPKAGEKECSEDAENERDKGWLVKK